MIVARTPSNRVEERRYALDVALAEYLGLEFRHEPGERDDVALELDGRALTVADGLFATPESGWLQRESLPQPPLARRDGLPVLWGDASEAEGALGLDVFGGVFFLLTRYEEAVLPDRDRHGRFPASASVGHRERFLGRPLANEYLELLWDAMHRLWPGLERRRRSFRVLPSHDVDSPRCPLSSPLEVARFAALDVLKRRDPGLAARRLRSFAGRGPDVCDTFSWLLDATERRGLRSAFYFIPARTSEHDGAYSLDDPLVRDLLREIDARGHEIGLHPSYGSFADPAQVQRERSALADACTELGIEQAPVGGRQHFLRWENPTTWQAWSDAGLEYDSTLHFPDEAGFRSGACFEHPVFNLVTRRTLPLRERPLIVMEASLLQYEALGYDAAAERALSLRETCKRFGGDFTVLWHNNRLQSRRDRELYETLLDG